MIPEDGARRILATPHRTETILWLLKIIRRENSWVDIKGDIPNAQGRKNAAANGQARRTVAAIANSGGGLVIVGVWEESLQEALGGDHRRITEALRGIPKKWTWDDYSRSIVQSLGEQSQYLEPYRVDVSDHFIVALLVRDALRVGEPLRVPVKGRQEIVMRQAGDSALKMPTFPTDEKEWRQMRAADKWDTIKSDVDQVLSVAAVPRDIWSMDVLTTSKTAQPLAEADPSSVTSWREATRVAAQQYWNYPGGVLFCGNDYPWRIGVPSTSRRLLFVPENAVLPDGTLHTRDKVVRTQIGGDHPRRGEDGRWAYHRSLLQRDGASGAVDALREMHESTATKVSDLQHEVALGFAARQTAAAVEYVHVLLKQETPDLGRAELVLGRVAVPDEGSVCREQLYYRAALLNHCGFVASKRADSPSANRHFASALSTIKVLVNNVGSPNQDSPEERLAIFTLAGVTANASIKPMNPDPAKAKERLKQAREWSGQAGTLTLELLLSLQRNEQYLRAYSAHQTLSELPKASSSADNVLATGNYFRELAALALIAPHHRPEVLKKMIQNLPMPTTGKDRP